MAPYNLVVFRQLQCQLSGTSPDLDILPAEISKMKIKPEKYKQIKLNSMTGLIA
jgi:hypothetical protein